MILAKFKKKKISKSLVIFVPDAEVTAAWVGQQCATPFQINTPPVEDFGKAFYRGSENF